MTCKGGSLLLLSFGRSCEFFDFGVEEIIDVMMGSIGTFILGLLRTQF